MAPTSSRKISRVADEFSRSSTLRISADHPCVRTLSGRPRDPLLHLGRRHTEFGEEQVNVHTELRVRYYL